MSIIPLTVSTAVGLKPLSPEEILLDFCDSEKLPVEALKAATEQRETILPLFLDEIDHYLALSSAARLDPGPTPLFFIFHLLGEWRETRAYQPLAQLLHMTYDEADILLGDATTSTAHRVMASVFDGNPQPLYDIILDEKADEYVRSSMLQTLVLLVRENLLAKDVVATFLREAYDKIRPRNVCFIWYEWMSSVAKLGLEDLRPRIRQIYDEGMADVMWCDIEDFDKDFKHALTNPGYLRHEWENKESFWTDTIGELSQWSGFSEKNDGEFLLDDKDEETIETFLTDKKWALPPMPVINDFRDVGRNDPCPCGSQKKYKKCCMNVVS